MKKKRKYIGIEGIGMRQCVGVLADSEGRIHSSVRLIGEPISLHTMPRELLGSRLLKIVNTLLHQSNSFLPDLSNTTICIGLTGVTFRYDRELDLPHEISTKLPMENSTNLICTGDAEIVFVSHTQSFKGSAILCLSGSTAYVTVPKEDGVHHIRFGGWGPALGDRGSGFAIGLAALRSISEEHDSGQTRSILWDEIQDWFMHPDPSIPAWVEGSQHWQMAMRDYKEKLPPGTSHIDYRPLICYFSHKMQGARNVGFEHQGMELWRKITSGLTIPVLKAWRKKSLSAQKIVDHTIKDLSLQYIKACKVAAKRFDIPAIFEPLVLYGGVLTHNPDFRDKFVEHLKKSMNLPQDFRFLVNTSDRTMRPVCGALLLALGHSTTGKLRLPVKSIIDQVYEDQKKIEYSQQLAND